MTMLLIRADFAKSYIAAHTRTLPSGKVIQVGAFSDKRYKQAMRDVKTPDMFKPALSAPGTPIPMAAARNPADFTPDLFTGETRAKPITREKRDSLESAHQDRVAKSPAVERQFRAKYNALAEAKADGVAMQSRCREVRAWVSDEKIAGSISESDYHKWMGMVDDIHDEKQPVAPDNIAQAATKPVASAAPKEIEDKLFTMLDRIHVLIDQGQKADEVTYESKRVLAFLDKAKADGKINGAQHYQLSTRLDGARSRLAKSSPDILFFKSRIKAYTDKNGRMVKEHDDKRTKKLETLGPGRAAAKVEPGSAHGYGPHNVEAGDALKFKAGDFAGGGKVKSVGQDGVTVTDASGRDHGVHWHEVAGRGGKEPEQQQQQAPAEQKPVEDAVKGGGDEEGKLKAMEGTINDGVRQAGMQEFFAKESEALPHKVASKFKTWEELDAASKEAQDELVAILKKSGDALGGQSVRFDTYDYNKPGIIYGVGPIKTKESATRKVSGKKYNGDWSRLGDLVRGSVGFDSVEEMKDGIEKLKAAGLKLATKADNKFTNPTDAGYRDMNLNILMSNGVVGELQLHLKPILDAKNAGHKFYEESRILGQSIEAEKSSVKEPSADYRPTGQTKEDRYAELMRSQRKLYGNAMAKALGKTDAMIKALQGKIILFFKGRAKWD